MPQEWAGPAIAAELRNRASGTAVRVPIIPGNVSRAICDTIPRPRPANMRSQIGHACYMRNWVSFTLSACAHDLAKLSSNTAETTTPGSYASTTPRQYHYIVVKASSGGWTRMLSNKVACLSIISQRTGSQHSLEGSRRDNVNVVCGVGCVELGVWRMSAA